ncbi:MAG: SpoIIE family protein phosphatase [Leptospiraceae bacterium]|nr:SpoIIE family protein phosphatase [Leptospiraceae bacterium]
MPLPDFIQLNFHAISSSTAAAFTIFASLFFLVSVPRRSSATIHLGLGLLFIGIANVAYLLTSTIYHPGAAFHRYLTVFFVPLAALHFGHFFWNFPKNPTPRLARFTLIAQWMATAVLTALFIHSTLHGERWFRFSAHYWDFAEWELSSYIANLIAFFVLMVPGLATWKMIRNDRQLRWTVFWMMLAFLAGTLVPAIANKLSHAGKMSRGNFQVLYNLMTILGFFALIVIYINKTLDRTTFMAKIVGISLVTILVIFQWLSYASYLQAEKAYDSLRRKDMQLAMVSDKRAPDLLYLIEHGPAEDRYVFQKGQADLPPGIAVQFMALEAYEDLKRNDRARVALPENSADQGALQAYGKFLNNLAKEDPSNYNAKFRQLQDELRIRRIQIRMIPDRLFESKIRTELKNWASSPGILQPFDQLALSAFQDRISHPGLSPEEMKVELMHYYMEAHPDGFRYYRHHPEYGHVICFALPDDDGHYFEAGYSYLDYRKEQMNVAVNEMWMLLGCLFIVVVGFRLFFLRTLTDPLQALLQGVQKINSGDLNIRLPVLVQDEIGFLTGSFNRMVSSIRGARGKLQDYATTLEDRVQERTLELEDTLKRIQDLKTRQDGDFFLTSLLIHPLTANQVQSSRVRTETLLLQKKTFSFRRWEGEIGGDFCSTHTIQLRGMNYIAFMNGDAMGKSLQGAAGALILGSVFESIIQRTELSLEIQSLYPEMWLRDAYLELQKIFCTFDGYMMASMVMGLVDEESGLLYFLNAEHPWPVLFRNQKASFPVIEEERIIHKLGIPQAERNLRIYTLPLQPGDLFISGSDGRDDIVLGIDAEGNRIYNMDESLILGVVEQAGGELPRIPEMLKQKGQISDDLSLLGIRFECMRREPPLLTEKPGSGNPQAYLGDLLGLQERLRKEGEAIPETLYRELFETYFRLQDFEHAAELIDFWPGPHAVATRYLYLASYALKRANRLEEARIQGERMLLREPDHANNLVNLADIYRMLGIVQKAESCVQRALELRPGHKSAELISRTLAELREEID